jgi:hypothetical protein
VFLFLLEEFVMIRTGWLAWNGVIRGLAVWPGRRYQIPLTEMAIFGATCAAMAALRFFRDDTGHAVVERGLDDVKTPKRTKEILGLLAVVGFANLAMITYNVLTVPLSLYVGQTPANPTYMRNGICGPGTPYACPGPRVPIILPQGRGQG